MFGGTLRIRMRIRFATAHNNPVFGVVIHDALGIPVSNVQSIHHGFRVGDVSTEISIEVFFDKLALYPGRYFLSPNVMDSARQRDLDFPRMCVAFEVHPAPGEHGDLKLDPIWGKVFIPSKWKVGAHC
jgi:hypothetical protein